MKVTDQPVALGRASGRTGASDDHSCKVSVVIPVYNAGRDADANIRGLLAQTLSPDEFEVIFIDDGSTDHTPQMLDELAEKHSHFRVFHIPNTGWPGKPRNIGIENARGKYVFFVDHDDFVAPDALRRMYEMAERNQSDIVVGKSVSNYASVPSGLWKRNRDRVSIRDFNLQIGLTPHKFMRTSFIHEHGLRYAEEPRRVEDALFMMQAYFATDRVSIIGDYTCYYRLERQAGGNISRSPVSPAKYLGDLRGVLDVVWKNTEPGRRRNEILSRFYANNVLMLLHAARLAERREDGSSEVFEEACKILDYFPEEMDDDLQLLPRVKALSARAGDLEGIVRIAENARAVTRRATLENIEWRNGALQIGYTAELLDGDGEPLKFYRDGRTVRVDEKLFGSWDDPKITDSASYLNRSGSELFVRNRDTHEEWLLPVRRTVEFEDRPDGTVRVYMRNTATLEPTNLGGGNGLLEGGLWDLTVKIRMLGIDRQTRLGGLRLDPVTDAVEAGLPGLFGDPVRRVVPYVNRAGHLSLAVDHRAMPLSGAVDTSAVSPEAGDGRRLEVRLPVASVPGTEPIPVRARLRPASETGETRTTQDLAAVLRPKGHHTVVAVEMPARTPAGSYVLSAVLEPSAEEPMVDLGTVIVDRRGRGHLAGARRITLADRLRGRLRARKKTLRLARRVAARLPLPVRRPLLAVWHRIR